MIALEQKSIPDILEGNETIWGQEFADSINVGGTPVLRYRHHDIRNALSTETKGKCSYCESRIEHVSYAHIEHILPKSVIPLLVCTWSNLTLACQVCNTNKGSYHSETSPLLNPYIDDVESLISFYGPMAIDRDERAKLTISKLHLNRPELMYQRYEKLKSTSRLLELIVRSEGNEALIQALYSDLEEALENAAEYASCSRYFIEAENENYSENNEGSKAKG